MAITANIMDATVNTMRSDAVRPRHRPSPAAAVAAGLLGCMLLALGLPQLIAGALTADSQDVLWEIAAGRTPERAALDRAADRRESATRWEASAERETDRGILLVRQADATPPGPERDRLVAAAGEAITHGLSLGPVQPYGWAVLAALREKAGDRTGAVQALRLSMLSGAFEPSLMLWRIDMGLRLIGLMGPENEALLRGQVRKAWVMAPDKIALLAQTPQVGPFVRHALEELSDAEIADYVRRYGQK